MHWLLEDSSKRTDSNLSSNKNSFRKAQLIVCATYLAPPLVKRKK